MSRITFKDIDKHFQLLVNKTVYIGRDPKYRIDDINVSKKQEFEVGIEFDGNNATATCFGINSSYLNGEEMIKNTPYPLKTNDLIHLLKNQYEFVINLQHSYDESENDGSIKTENSNVSDELGSETSEVSIESDYVGVFAHQEGSKGEQLVPKYWKKKSYENFIKTNESAEINKKILKRRWDEMEEKDQQVPQIKVPLINVEILSL